jgi:hypothetical protein
VVLLISLDPFALGLFWNFIPKGENVRPKQACGLKLTSSFKDTYKWFKGYETKGGECEHEDQKGEGLI